MKGDVFEPNALVFAKIRGYPAWPAKVTAVLDDSKKPKKYSVFFFGTYEVATVKVEDLFAYNAQTKEKYGNVNVKRKGFLEAMQEIEGSPDMEVTGLPPPVTATPRSVASAGNTPSGTPKGRGRGKKRKEDASTPPEPAGKRRRLDSGEAPGGTPAPPPTEPVLSRSGRKIKPKRFADATEQKMKSPPTGRRQAAAAQPASGEDTPRGLRDEDAQEEEEEDEVVPEEEEVLPMEVAEGGAGDGPGEQAAQPDDQQEPESERRDVRYKPYPAHETEDIVRVADSASLQRGEDGRKVMFVKAKCGEMLEIDISDKERPKEFKSEKARIMWDTATAINLRRLRHQLEQGQFIPDRLREKLLARADIAQDYKKKLKDDKRAEMRRSKLWWLRDEARLIEMDYHIKLNLIIDEQNHDKCLEVFKELAVMNMAPLMLKKNPEIVETVRKCRKYTGSAEIREVADQCYQRFKKMFVVPKGMMFREYFDVQLAMFRKVTEEMPVERVVRMVRDPLFQRPGEASSDSEDDSWPPAPPNTNGAGDPEQTNGAQEKHTDRTDAPAPGEQGTAAPAEAGSASPQKSDSASPQKPGSDSPQKTGSDSPQKAGSDNSQKAGSDSPQKEGSDSSQKTGSDSPQKAGSDSPQKAGSDSPQKTGSDSPQKADSASLQKTGTDSPQKAGSDSPQKAGSDSPQKSKTAETETESTGGDSPAPPQQETTKETPARTGTETTAEETKETTPEPAETDQTAETEPAADSAEKEPEPGAEEQPEPEPEPEPAGQQ